MGDEFLELLAMACLRLRAECVGTSHIIIAVL